MGDKGINLVAFVALMGTSALALASKQIVGGALGNAFAYLLELSVILVFLVHFAKFILHIAAWGEFVKGLHNPTKANLYSAMPIASALISIMATAIGIPGCRQCDFAISAAFWAVSLVFSLAFVVIIPVNLKFRSKVEQVLGTWFLPPVGLFVLVTAGSLLASRFGLMPTGIGLLNLLLLGPAFVLYGLTLALVYFRSKFFLIENAAVVPTFNIVLAPVGVSILAVLSTSRLLSASDAIGVMPLFSSIAKLYSIIIFGYGLWVLLSLPLLYLRVAREHSAIPFSELWWALVFPLGAFTMAAANIHPLIGSVWAMGAFCQLLYVLLFLLWGYVLIGYIRKRGSK